MKCSKCKKEKNTDCFSWKNKANGIRCKVCKDCHSAYVKKHYKTNKKEYLARAKIHNKEYVQRNRSLLIEFLKDKKCLDCGRTDPRVLEFDHTDRKNKTTNISEMVKNSLSWATILKEIEKCEIRCVLCHRIKTCEESGFYKSLGVG